MLATNTTGPYSVFTCMATRIPHERRRRTREQIRSGARALRRLQLGSFAALGAGILIHFASPKPEWLEFLGLALFGLAAALLLLLRFSECPQCGKLFFGAFLRRRGLPSKCASCGLALYSGPFRP